MLFLITTGPANASGYVPLKLQLLVLRAELQIIKSNIYNTQNYLNNKENLELGAEGIVNLVNLIQAYDFMEQDIDSLIYKLDEKIRANK